MCYMNFAINGYTREYMTLAKDDIGVEYVGECVIVVVDDDDDDDDDDDVLLFRQESSARV